MGVDLLAPAGVVVTEVCIGEARGFLELATVSVRYKRPSEDASMPIDQRVPRRPAK